MKVIVFTTALPRDECVRRLRARVPPDQANHIGGSIAGQTGAIVGKIRDTRIRLRRVPAGVNAFATYLYGSLAGRDNQTHLRCFIGPHPSALGHMVFCFAFMPYAAYRVITDLQDGITTDLRDGIIMLAFALYISALHALGRFHSRKDAPILCEFIRATIEANAVPLTRGLAWSSRAEPTSRGPGRGPTP